MKICEPIKETSVERDNRLLDSGWINPFKEKWGKGRPSMEKRMRRDLYFIWKSFQVDRFLEPIKNTFMCRHKWSRKPTSQP